MPAKSGPQGPDSGGVAVAVEFVHQDADPIHVIMLADPSGLLMHYKEKGSQPCRGLGTCPKTFHDIKPRWHGFIPVLFRTSTRPEIWEHRILDASAGICRRFEGRSIRGEHWQLIAHENEQGYHPTTGDYLGLVPLPDDLVGCSLVDELRRFFNLAVLPPFVANTMPGRQYLPPVRLATQAETPVERPDVYVPPPEVPAPPAPDPSVAALLAEAERLEKRTSRGINPTAERIRAQLANGFKLPK